LSPRSRATAGTRGRSLLRNTRTHRRPTIRAAGSLGVPLLCRPSHPGRDREAPLNRLASSRSIPGVERLPVESQPTAVPSNRAPVGAAMPDRITAGSVRRAYVTCHTRRGASAATPGHRPTNSFPVRERARCYRMPPRPGLRSWRSAARRSGPLPRPPPPPTIMLGPRPRRR